jgi:hypothetical protein
MEPGDRRHEAETESISGSSAASLQAVKTFEDVLTFIDGNSALTHHSDVHIFRFMADDSKQQSSGHLEK